MISHGDEIGRTQRGNNNVYCQDSELSWMDWSLCETNADLLAFTRKVVQFRKNHPVFRRRRFFEGKPIRSGDQARDIAWLTPAGKEMTPEDWGTGFGQCVAVFLNGDAIPAPNDAASGWSTTPSCCASTHTTRYRISLRPRPATPSSGPPTIDTARPDWRHRSGGRGRREDPAAAALAAACCVRPPDTWLLQCCRRIGCRCAATASPSPTLRSCCDYLDELGVSHLYLSPILTAPTGSTHGYDVTDPTTVSAALGGHEGLAAAGGGGARTRHGPDRRHRAQPRRRRQARAEPVVVGRADARPRLAVRVVLRHRLGPGPDGRIVLPVLGSDDDVAASVDGTCCGSATWPIAPGTGRVRPEVHDRQHYRLIGWRHGVCGYRRFFSITSLAGLRQEDRAVFDATHVEVKRWFDEGLVDGVRIDHPDGLSDPGRLSRLAARTRRAAGVDRDREDPGRRRGAGPHAAGRGHHRL